MDEIIELKKLPSGATAIATETSSDAIGLEIGSSCIFFEADDIYGFIRLLKAADKYFLRK